MVCFGTVNTALLLPNPVCICLSVLLSISQIQMPCKSVSRQQRGSVPVVLCFRRGILRGSRVHITLSLHVVQECLVCTHTKVLVIFIVCCCFFKWRFLLFGAISFSFFFFFYSPPRGSVVFQSDCGPFPSASDSTAWGFCLPLWQWLPRTEAAGSDVW